ncbi:MAG: phospho-N-acetylmuramoyl-pentapeptide-transferase [Clostridia bacterium]|nr:phospho-N-acetylmuramoyl-pentapeptide-transferase [Clostridia bacterium]
MIKYLLAVIISFFAGMLIAPLTIKVVKRLRVKQTILSYVQQHESKQGIPTMGGAIFILPAVATSFLLGGGMMTNFAVLIMLSYGMIGFLDDFLKVTLKRNLGLRAYQKIISQLLIAAIASYFAYKSQFIGPEIKVPMFNTVINLKWWYLPFSIFVYVALSNSCNLTDGLDGLAGSTSCIYFMVFFIITFMQMTTASDSGRTLYAQELSSLLVFLAALIGGIIAFLWFNSFRAKIIMGDMGALALGGTAAMVAMVTGNPFLILLTGIMFVTSSISVIIQVAVFKATKGKRVFLMAPLHHHLELKGINESKIVSFYMIITFIGGVVSLIIM